jgi:transposase
MQIRSVGIDLGKTTFHLVALGDNGKVLLRKKFTQKQLITFTANMQSSLIGMEACSRSPFSRPGIASTGSRCEADSSSVCEAVWEVEQERLHRC